MVSALQKFGKFIFLEEQETSGLGATWRAAELAGGKIDHNLLADIIAPNLAGDPGFRDQYNKQSTLSAKLEHPNLLRKVTTTTEGGDLFSFYEYQEGFTLEKVMKRCQAEMNPFSVDHALLVVSKLLSALAYAKTKHLTHGFVNPSMIFVTHEGEIKLKGYAFSSALRAAKNAPAISDYYRNYVPAGMSLTSDDRDRMDIYGCGAILYEMLVGEPFKGSGDVAGAIGGVVTAHEGEAIPPKIAAILVKSLGEGYKDIQVMAKDMDELLFSGEYSPTTFNLAFFMHSAFRQEMEELGERVASEKEKNYGDQPKPAAAAAAASSAAAPPPPKPRQDVAPPPKAAAAPAPPPKANRTPLLVGGLVALVVVAGVAWFLLKPKPEENSTISKIQGQLLQEGKEQEKARKLEEQEELRRQNAELQELLRSQSEQEIARKQEELESEMADIDKRIMDAKRRKEAEEERKNLQAELERVKKMLERQQEQARKEEAAKTEPIKPKPKEGEPAAEKPAQTAVADATQPKTLDKPAPKEETAEPDKSAEEVVAAPSEAPEALKPPEPGELVLLSDEQLRRPELLQTVPQLDAPKKAVREGLVKKNKPAFFIMRILINDQGEVEQANLQRRSLPKSANDWGMEEEARKEAMKTRWSVPTKQGVPVRVWSYVTITFYAK